MLASPPVSRASRETTIINRESDVPAIFVDLSDAFFASMFSGFNGDFRRGPVVSMRGTGNARKETKDECVIRLKAERAQREVRLLKVWSVL